MKVFVDEMPKSCWDCPCFHVDDDQSGCALAGDDYLDKNYYRGDDADFDCVCPLEDIAEHDAKLTKQVCQELVAAVTKKMK